MVKCGYMERTEQGMVWVLGSKTNHVKGLLEIPSRLPWRGDGLVHKHHPFALFRNTCVHSAPRRAMVGPGLAVERH